MATVFNIATANSSAAGTAVIPSGSTVVVFDGTNLTTANGGGSFQTLAAPLTIGVNEVAFGSGSSVTGSLNLLFHSDVTTLQVSSSNDTNSFLFLGVTASLATELTGTLSSALGLPYTSGGVAGRNLAGDGWVKLVEWGNVNGVDSTINLGTNGVGNLRLVSENNSITLTGSVVVVTGAAEFPTGLSGSLTQLTDGTPFILAGANITVTSASNGAITIAGSNADTEGHVTASVVTTDTTPTLLQSFTIPVSSAYSLDFKILAVQDDFSNRGQFVRNVFAWATASAECFIQGNVTAAILDNKSDGTWDISFTTNTDTVELWVTGSASPVSWSSNINYFSKTN